jgi:hypothetical protein
MSDKARPKRDPEDTRATPTSGSPDIGGRVPPIPGPNPPNVESPHDFVRRRMRELREAEAAKRHDADSSLSEC